ncbi:hypothetical protein CLCR_02420 [Cladophialophora carrionii]|uniref:Uncharacterized protein n=1 Tax=Cladophialophora carrionii TaxID=86049 RepID=A0A1C1CEZ2_9EURO|nr:hypothetical protein CLCR_02420 [Cladophialophora carrionii]
MTLIDHTGLPRWVYIVIIAVGSILLLAILAVGLRCWVLRRKARQRHEFDGLTGGPMRRVTLRRGRVVPSSQHLSLTGSKFGMRQFGILADNDSMMTGRRSPFEWWGTIMERSQSRQDQMSQVETGSIMTRPASRATTITGRKEVDGTPTQTPEKDTETVTRTWELTLPSPSPSPSPLGPNRTTNFSRSFSNRGTSSPITQRSQATLSRISERSPHDSIISAANGPNVSSQHRSSYHSAINPLDNTPLQERMPQPSPTTPRKSANLAIPSPRNRPPTQLPSPSHDSSTPSHLRSTSGRQSRRYDALPDQASGPSLPKAVAHPITPTAFRLNLPEFSSPISNSFYRQPNPSRLDVSHSRADSNVTSLSASTTHSPRKSSSSVGPSGVFYETQVPRTRNGADYWSARVDSDDVPPAAQRESSSGVPRSGHSRNPSTDQHRQSRYSRDEQRGEVQENRIGIMTVPGKHNTRVLRKKSLRRGQVVSSLAT